MITPNQLIWALVVAVVIVALGAAAWYVFAPAEDLAVPTGNTTPGTITGSVTYPSEGIPAQRVCAQSVTNPTYERCTETSDGEHAGVPPFTLKVAPGTYEVYAFLKNPADLGLDEAQRAYYTEFVTCGLAVGCTSHARIPVSVAPGATVTGVDPIDWYE